MLKMSLIGLFIGLVRIFIQRKDLFKLTVIEKIQTTIVYCIGMALLFGAGTFILKWTSSLVIHEILQILVFSGILFVLYIAIHIIMAILLPNSLAKEEKGLTLTIRHSKQ